MNTIITTGRELRSLGFVDVPDGDYIITLDVLVWMVKMEQYWFSRAGQGTRQPRAGLFYALGAGTEA